MSTVAEFIADPIGATAKGLRVAIGMYFLAGAAAVAMALPPSALGWVLALGAGLAAVWAILGWMLRSAAVTLAIFAIWSQMFGAEVLADPVLGMAALMRDMAIIAALLLTSQALRIEAPVRLPGATLPGAFLRETAAVDLHATNLPGPLVLAASSAHRPVFAEDDFFAQSLLDLDRVVVALARRRNA